MTGRPRLLVLSPSADLYGSDRSLLHALPGLAERFDLTLVSAIDGPLLDAARDLGVECRVTPDWALRRWMLRPGAVPAASRRVRAALRLLRRLHEERPFAAIYANTIANAALPFLKRYVPAPLVVHIRELPRDKPRQLRALLTVVDRYADSVVCNSGFTASAAIGVTPGLADRTRVVLNGIAPPGREPAASPRDGRLHVACVGRLHPKKGQGVLIEAAMLAHSRGADWHLHFHGDALEEHRELAEDLRLRVARAGLLDRVTWHGYNGDTDRLYDHADVVVVPSVVPEEFSLVTAEAQLRGLPVVATGPGGPSEIVSDGSSGRIVAPRDPAALAAALEELGADPAKRLAWGETGRRRAVTRFGLDRYRQEIVRRIADVVERRPGVLVMSPSADLYGSDRALLHALPALTARAPVTVLLAAPGPFADEAREAGAAVIETVDFAARRRFLRPRSLPAAALRSLRTLVLIRRICRKREIGLVYVNTVAVPIIGALRPAVRRPVLVHVHEQALGGRAEAALIRWTLRFGADVLVANSRWAASTLSESAQPRTRVVYNGVEPTPEPERGAVGCGFRVICVARLHPKKGHLVLLEALHQLVDNGVDIHLDLLGDALAEHTALEAAIRGKVDELGLCDRVVFHGYVADPDLLYRANDVVVVPSVSPEEFSLVAAEGQMRGLAAVVTGPGGVAEVVQHGETGYVVPANDADALADALGRLAADPDQRARMGAAGRRRMLANFTVDRYRTDIADVVFASMPPIADAGI